MKSLMIAGLMTFAVVLPLLLRAKKDNELRPLWASRLEQLPDNLRYDTSEFLDTL